ncbi:MAG: DNA repair protein RecO [Candidatus Bipolaricaulota bacterium]|nr:DNA repair protein RecO [Candidatus Bipolaricaulota bacterium]
MTIEKATVFVIRKVNFKDSDYVVTLFGRGSGKFAGIAKGARKLESKFGGVFDLLNMVEVVFYQSSGLDFISEAELIENWEGMRNSGEAIDAGLRSARMVNKLLEEGQREIKAYDLIEETLSSLDESQVRSRVVELSFYLKLFRHLGYQPQLMECSRCGRPVEDEDPIKFSPEAGGVVCTKCSTGNEFQISAGLRKVFVKLIRTPQSKVKRLKVTENQLQEGFTLLDRFGQFHFGQKLILRAGSSPEPL